MLATALGLLLGLPAGYLGGRVDQILMRILDVFFAFPAILLAILVVAILGTSVRNLVLTIAIIYTPRLARIVRAPILTVKERDFVAAAHAAGAAHGRIVLRHVLPNIATPIVVEVSLALGQVMLTESALSFLGFGPPPSCRSTGALWRRAAIPNGATCWQRQHAEPPAGSCGVTGMAWRRASGSAQDC